MGSRGLPSTGSSRGQEQEVTTTWPDSGDDPAPGELLSPEESEAKRDVWNEINKDLLEVWALREQQRRRAKEAKSSSQEAGEWKVPAQGAAGGAEHVSQEPTSQRSHAGSFVAPTVVSGAATDTTPRAVDEEPRGLGGAGRRRRARIGQGMRKRIGKGAQHEGPPHVATAVPRGRDVEPFGGDTGAWRRRTHAEQAEGERRIGEEVQQEAQQEGPRTAAKLHAVDGIEASSPAGEPRGVDKAGVGRRRGAGQEMQKGTDEETQHKTTTPGAVDGAHASLPAGGTTVRAVDEETWGVDKAEIWRRTPAGQRVQKRIAEASTAILDLLG